MGIRHRAFSSSLFDQRGEFSDPVTLKAADNTEFTARPTYSYKVMKNRAIDIVFDNKHIDKADTPSGKDGFMQSLEDNILSRTALENSNCAEKVNNCNPRFSNSLSTI